MQSYEKPLFAAPSFGPAGDAASNGVSSLPALSGLASPTPAPQGISRRSPDLLAMLALVGKLQQDINLLTGQRDRLVARCGELDEQLRGAACLQRELIPRPCAVRGAEISTQWKRLNKLESPQTLLTTYCLHSRPSRSRPPDP